MKAIVLMIVLGIVGLVVGYLIFGHINGNYVNIEAIFSAREGILDRAVGAMAGLDKMRNNILISGAVGAGLGLVIGVMSGGKRQY